MSLIRIRAMKVVTLLVMLVVADGRPQQQTYIPSSSQSASEHVPQQSFYVPSPQQASTLPSSSNQQQFLTQPPIQLHIPIPNDGVQEKRIYVQLPPQQYSQQQPQYRFPPRKHYKIILVRSPPQPTAPPAPVQPEIEEQTLVYVLVRKPDSPSAAQLQQLQQQQQQSFKLNKPEVYFIKYNSNEQKADSSAISDKAKEQSIEQQLSNNLERGYAYDATREREAKSLEQNEGADTVEMLVVEPKQ